MSLLLDTDPHRAHQYLLLLLPDAYSVQKAPTINFIRWTELEPTIYSTYANHFTIDADFVITIILMPSGESMGQFPVSI